MQGLLQRRCVPAALLQGCDRSAFEMLVPYGVPGLALAEYGWMSPGGSQARNHAPW